MTTDFGARRLVGWLEPAGAIGRGVALALALLTSGAALPGRATHPEPIGLRRTIEYDRYAKIPSNIRSKCGLHDAIPQSIADNSEQISLLDADQPFEGPILEVVIRSIGAASNGISSLSTVTIRGRLLREGQVIASFKSTRQAGESIGDRYRNMFSGTCGSFAGAVERLGADVGDFIAEPSMNAELGLLW